MFYLFKIRTDETEVYWTGGTLPSGKAQVSRDLTKAHPFQTRDQAYSSATIDGLLEFRVGERPKKEMQSRGLRTNLRATV